MPKETKDKLIQVLTEKEQNNLIDDLNALDMNTGWSDSKKWLADLVKSLILWAVVLLVTLRFLNTIDDQRNAARYRSQKLTELQINSINSFKYSSQTYLFTGSDIYYKKDTSPVTYKNFKSVIFDQMAIDISDLRRYFNDPKIMMDLDEYEKDIKQIFASFIKPIMDGKVIFTFSSGDTFSTYYNKINETRKAIISEIMESLFHMR